MKRKLENYKSFKSESVGVNQLNLFNYVEGNCDTMIIKNQCLTSGSECLTVKIKEGQNV